MSLPPGDEDQAGVSTVKTLTESLGRLAKAPIPIERASALRGYVDEINRYCDATWNPSAFRVCQLAANDAIDPLLCIAKDLRQEVMVKKDKLTEVRSAALETLARICFGNMEGAAATVSSELFVPTVEAALRPVVSAQHQLEHLAALQLLQAIAAVAAEAPSLSSVLPSVVDLASSVERSDASDEGTEAASENTNRHGAFRAVRTTAIEVLLSLSFGRNRREEIASLLPPTSVGVIIEGRSDTADFQSFTVGLLFANLCELVGPETDDGVRFDTLLDNFWERTGFFSDVAACFDAALRREEWPPGSNIYHMPWKLASVCMRLASAGHAHRLQGTVMTLVECVLRRLPSDDNLPVSADDSRAARLAAVALLAFAMSDTEALALLRRSARLSEALSATADEEPAARELLDMLASTA